MIYPSQCDDTSNHTKGGDGGTAVHKSEVGHHKEQIS